MTYLYVYIYICVYTYVHIHNDPVDLVHVYDMCKRVFYCSIHVCNAIFFLSFLLPRMAILHSFFPFFFFKQNYHDSVDSIHV